MGKRVVIDLTDEEVTEVVVEEEEEEIEEGVAKEEEKVVKEEDGVVKHEEGRAKQEEGVVKQEEGVIKQEDEAEEEQAVAALLPQPFVCAAQPQQKITLTDEQKAIVQTVLPPGATPQVVRVTAAAGTGKTTTLEHVAKQMLKLGHVVKYLTFSKSAAEDAQSRMPNDINMQTSTIHSCAMQLSFPKSGQRVKLFEASHMGEDAKFDHLADHLLQNDIEDFCHRWSRYKQLEAAKQRSTYKKVRYLIKTGFKKNWLVNKFNEKEGFDSTTFGTVYYPAIIYHSEQQGWCNKNDACTFYCKCSKKLWDYFLDQARHKEVPETMFDVMVKLCHLEKKRINATALLVDESQDLTPCQVDWMYAQTINHGCHLYFVGDAAQSIYSFRGASAANLLDTSYDRHTKDCKLTESFRFGKNIGNVANVLLACKELSPQTIDMKNRQWTPYRVNGKGNSPGVVTFEHDITKLTNNFQQQATIIARSNVELFTACLSLLGYKENIEVNDTEKDELEPPYMPKIALNSKGALSGAKAWKKDENKLKALVDVFTSSHSENGVGASFNYYPFQDESFVTWNMILEEVEKEDSPLAKLASLVNRFGVRTMELYNLFKLEVLNKNYEPEMADLILTTVHSSKGMEWDLVLVLDDDLCNLSKYKVVDKGIRWDSYGTLSRCASADQLRHIDEKQGMIDCKSYGDDINMWYVAITRAKKVLGIPPKLKTLLLDWIKIGEAADRYENHESDMNIDGTKNMESIYLGVDENLEVKELEPPHQLSPVDCFIVNRDVVVPALREITRRDSVQLLIDGQSCIYPAHFN